MTYPFASTSELHSLIQFTYRGEPGGAALDHAGAARRLITCVARAIAQANDFNAKPGSN